MASGALNVEPRRHPRMQVQAIQEQQHDEDPCAGGATLEAFASGPGNMGGMDPVDLLTSPRFRQLIESRDAQFGALAHVAWAEGVVTTSPVVRGGLLPVAPASGAARA